MHTVLGLMHTVLGLIRVGMCSIEHYPCIFTTGTELTDSQVTEQHTHTAKGVKSCPRRDVCAEQGHFSPFLLFLSKSELISLTGNYDPSYINST